MSSQSSKIVHLNVGGEKFTTTIGTLSREPESVLAKLVNEQWFPPGPNQVDQTTGNNDIFIDR